MKPDYRRWLESQKYAANTVVAQTHRASRVEEYYGDLDRHYAVDRLESVIDALRYSTQDARKNRPNPSKIPFDGDIRSNLASYRNAVERYRTFRDATSDPSRVCEPESSADNSVSPPEQGGQRIGLERDMQAALRLAIDQLEPGLTVIDDGVERSVDSGFIDITARDASGVMVIVELKAGVAGQRAIAQILSYMGDASVEAEGGRVRGILVASAFDPKAKAAARMVPNLSLRSYAVRFTFTDGNS